MSKPVNDVRAMPESSKAEIERRVANIDKPESEARPDQKLLAMYQKKCERQRLRIEKLERLLRHSHNLNRLYVPEGL